MPTKREREAKKRAFNEELTRSHNNPDLRGPIKKQRSGRERVRSTT